MRRLLPLLAIALLLVACGPENENEKVVVLSVTGTMCQNSCAPAIERMLMGVEGVRTATMTHATGTAEVVCAGSVEVDELIAAVQGPPYVATLKEAKDVPPAE